MLPQQYWGKPTFSASPPALLATMTWLLCLLLLNLDCIVRHSEHGSPLLLQLVHNNSLVEAQCEICSVKINTYNLTTLSIVMIYLLLRNYAMTLLSWCIMLVNCCQDAMNMYSQVIHSPWSTPYSSWWIQWQYYWWWKLFCCYTIWSAACGERAPQGEDTTKNQKPTKTTTKH